MLGSGWYPLNGTLDEFRMHNKALTNEEIQALYNSR